MPFLRYANAKVVGPRLQGAAWDNVRVAAGNARSDRNLVEQASKILKADFDPKNFLLTHATIVASVDTVLVKNARLGTFTENGKKIVRKTSNFRIKPECDALINNNLDCWSRDVLLKSYKTFIGAHSFCFAPGTDVQMGDGTYRPIEDICVGDSVITHTGEVRQVTHTFERDYEGPIRAIHVEGLDRPILATGNHPFRSLKSLPSVALSEERAWVRADEITVGTHLLGAEAKSGDCRVHRVTSNESHPYKGKVYNLEVEGDHSYVVTHGIAVHNCEHVQIEDLSKGRIIDAVARDVGDSVYVDILVANDRKHTDLIESIESGRLSTLSMGCFLPGTQVSLADGTRVAIEDVQVGDMVLTHKGRAREVLNKQIRGGKWGVQRIEAVGVPSAITATDIHPFFVLDPSLGSLREVQAQNLQVGDLLSNPGGTAGASITSLVPQTYEGWVHDMEVEEDHSYVVEGVAVHNCSIDGSTCTKCGHWAADETEFCECVKYSKGNTFYDEGGQRHRIAELCGDVSLDPTGGVTFIEASWVAVPAFTGAVARNVITVSEKSDPEKKTARRIRRVFNQPSPRIDPNAMKKAAFDLSADMFDEPEEAAPAEEKPAAPAPAVSPLDGIQDQLKKTILDKVKDELLAELTKSRLNEQLSSPPATPTDPNDSVIKQAPFA